MEQTPFTLSPPEQRVLGCLLEKEMATPEYYPLTLNALLNACNQKTNRDPVVSYDEETVLAAAMRLKDSRLVRQSNVGRAVKYEQIMAQSQQLTPREKAIVCVLLLRGPQTIGEVRGRTDRLYSFTDLNEVRETIENLVEMGLAMQLPLQPGRKEARFAHLLGGPPAEGEPVGTTAALTSDRPVHLAEMQAEIEQLRAEIAELRAEFSRFRAQFE